MPDLSTVDRRVLVSGVLAVLTAAILIGLIAFGPSQARLGGVVGLIGLTVVVQVTLLFLRPTDRSAFGKARSAFADHHRRQIQRCRLLVCFLLRLKWC